MLSLHQISQVYLIMKRVVFLVLVLFALCDNSKGQVSPEVKKLAQYMIDKTNSQDTKFGDKQSVRFLSEVVSIGNYEMSGQMYFINYPEAQDTSKVSKQASLVERVLSMQGAKRSFNKDKAAFVVNIYFTKTRDRRALYIERDGSIYGTGNMGAFSVFSPSRYTGKTGTKSSDNANLPYYRDSFGPAGQGRNRSLAKMHRSDHSFSVVIEGISREGKIIWRTISSDFRSAAVTDAILPYLCFAALGHLGVEGNSSLQFLSDNPVYSKWDRGLLNMSNTILYPISTSTKKIEVAAVIREHGKLMVVLKDRFSSRVFNTAYVFLEYDGKSVPVSESYIEDRLQNNNFPGLTIWNFLTDLDGQNEFDLVFYKDNNKKKEKFAIRNIKLAE